MHNTIKNLSPEVIQKLMTRYYAGEQISTLITEFEISVHPSRITTLFPQKIYNDKLCPYCQKPMVSRQSSRSALQTGKNLPIPHCEICKHKHKGKCFCANCVMELKLLNCT